MKTNNTASNTQSKDLTLVAKTFMKRYGHYVNEDRAMPALMDGLKPVHRRILWAMHLLGCHPNAKTVKSARIIGDVIGKYHPHGDSGAYTALVNMANQPSPFVYGEGNWGNILRDPAASMRYTSAKLTPLGASLFDPYYQPAMKMLPNYDGTTVEPLLLMAPVPTILLGYNMGIGVGAVCNLLPFTLESVVKLTELALKAHELGKSVTPALCAKTLKFTSTGGGVVEGQEEAVLGYMKTGNGSITMSSPYTCPPKQNNVMVFRKFAPVDITKKIARIAEFDGQVEINDLTSIENGYVYEVRLKNMAPQLLDPLKKKIAKEFETRITLNNNVTLRRSVEGGHQTKNIHVNVPEIMDKWVAWRIACDKVATTAAKKVTEDRIAYLNLLVFAVQNRDKIIKILGLRVPNDQLNARLAKELSITVEQAKVILDLRVRQLNALEKDALFAEIKTLKAKVAELGQRLVEPVPYLVQSAKALLAPLKKV